MVSLEKNQTCSSVRLPAGKKASQRLWMFKVKEEQNSSKRYKARLVVKGLQQKWRVDYNEIFSPIMKMTTISYTSQKRGFSASWAGRKPRVQIEGNIVRTDSSTEATIYKEFSKEPYSDVYQADDEREVKVPRSFNWPMSKLITDDGVLPERCYSQFNDVSLGYLVSKVS
ncbi:retrovirus-related pol polyprotein from transposon TNT 1-94 [Tanacetum coccineum]